MSVSTVVIQALNVAPSEWMQQCLESVRRWAAHNSLDYIFFDDANPASCSQTHRFVSSVPEWFAAKSTAHPQPIFDLARIQVIRELHKRYSRVIWFDADVFIFLPARLVLPEIDDAAFTQEIWTIWDDGCELFKERVTNCVCAYARGSRTLEEYRDASLHLAQTTPGPLPKSSVGTDLLSAMHKRTPLQLLPNVGNLSPHMVDAVATQDQKRLGTFRARTGVALYAVNLCSSHEGRDYLGIRNDQEQYLRAVDMLRQNPALLALESREGRACVT